jgi:hypothetical protein
MGKWKIQQGYTICCKSFHKPGCPGNLYKLEDGWNFRLVCKCETHLKEGKRYYRYVRGHGEAWNVEVVETPTVKD